jgi:hypothetical protein
MIVRRRRRPKVRNKILKNTKRIGVPIFFSPSSFLFEKIKKRLDNARNPVVVRQNNIQLFGPGSMILNFSLGGNHTKSSDKLRSSSAVCRRHVLQSFLDFMREMKPSGTPFSFI